MRSGVRVGLSIYYLFCGLTGVLIPESWFWAAGMDRALPGLLIQITGALLLAVGFGFWRAANSYALLPGLIFVAFWASGFDALVVASGMWRGELGALQGAGFLVVDALVMLVLAKGSAGLLHKK